MRGVGWWATYIVNTPLWEMNTCIHAEYTGKSEYKRIRLYSSEYTHTGCNGHIQP